jgi:4-amino-4-deoxychorismate lyase
VDSRWLVNGQPTGVDPRDRGLAYGDGLFETMAARAGDIRWLDWHFDRLEEGCRRLQIDAPARSVVERDISALCPTTGDHVVKLIVTRGPGGRGYRPPDATCPTRIVGISSWPDYPASYYTSGIRVQICELRLGQNPALAGLKHLCRLEQVLAQLELRSGDAQQGLLLDTDGRVVSGTSSNVFAVLGAQLVTPSLSRAGVKGVSRRAVLTAARELGIDAQERDLTLPELLAADALFMTNALVGIWPIASIDGQVFDTGATTRRLMRHLGYGYES